MSSKNIFEVLQNVAENPESNEKFLNILKENGFTGTLEEAENQINQQTQVVLNNLTTEDLQNIAGGKSLMNDKLKKALAVGGASLMAAGAVMPSGSALDMNKVKAHTKNGVDYVKENPVHTALTAIFGLTAATLFAKSIFGGKTKSGLPFTDAHQAFLWQMDLSADKNVLKFIDQLADENCAFELLEENKEIKIKFTKTKNSVLKNALEESTTPILFTTEALLLTLIQQMDKENTYVKTDNTLTSTGALVLNILTSYIVQQINDEVVKKAKEVEQAKTKADVAAKEAEAAQKAADAAAAAKKKADEEVEAKKKAGENADATQKAADDAAKEAEEATTKADAAAKEAEAAQKAAKEAQEKAGKFNNLKLEMPKSEFKVGDSVKPETKSE